MDFRATSKDINDYITEKSRETYKLIEAIEPDFRSSIEVSFTENMQALCTVLKSVADDFPDTEALTDITPDKRYACSQYVPVLIDTSEIYEFDERLKAQAVNEEHLKNNPPSYSAFKKHLRNAVVHSEQGRHTTRSMVYTAHQARSSYRLSCEIRLENNLLSATVSMAKLENRYDCGESKEVYKIPPVKLTKFLRKIEMSEKYCTLVSGKVSNKPMRLSIMFTDKYIPEAYISMSNKVSSCMSYEASNFGLPDHEHPTLCYEGSPDVMLCLIKDEDSTDDYPYINRAIINTSHWTYDTCYGNQIMHDLTPFGIQQSCGCMQDIRLKLIYSDNCGTLAPYVDGTDCRFREEGGYLVCDDDACEQSSYETGRLGGAYYCEYCDSNVEETCETYNGGGVCYSCLDEHFVHVKGRGHIYWDDTVGGEDSRGCEIRLYEGDALYSDYHSCYLHGDNSFYSDMCDSYLHDSDDEDAIFREMHDCDDCSRCDCCGMVSEMETQEEDEC